MTGGSSIALFSAVLAGIGVAQSLAGWRVAARFARTITPPAAERPPITVLKPLHGDEPLLEQGLVTVCAQDYPAWQMVFGVQDPADPAVSVVRRLQARFPDCDIALVIDRSEHGTNRKVGNLINMLPAAKHDVLVIADSDLHVRPDYLDRLAASLAQPNVGLVTTPYAGLPASRLLPALLGATQITHGFLPGALLARAMRRQDCLGATMCLRRETLSRIGGLRVLKDHLADDNLLGRKVQALGLRVALADTVPATTVPEASLGALFRHELRWARTIRALEPLGFAASVLQYPLFWALLAVAASGGAAWSWLLLALVWGGRAAGAAGVDRALAGRWSGPAAWVAFRCPIWLLPLRDLLSIVVLLTSYAGTRVDWRGHHLHAEALPADRTPPASHPDPLRPAEGLNPR